MPRSVLQNFNPRSRVGSDDHLRHYRRRQHDFNPRSRVGSDGRCMRRPTAKKRFQSTLPRGERLKKRRLNSGGKNFNPRSRVGSDVDYTLHDVNKGSDFNPRSRVGSDISRSVPFLCLMLFQSTLPRGERRSIPYPYLHCIKISIHAPAWGATSIFDLLLYG